MNIIRMTGGLGNQMFQYALYLKLKYQGKEVKFDDITEYEGRQARPILLWVFGIEYLRASRDEINEITDGFMKLTHRIRRKLFGRRSLEYQEKGCIFDEQVLIKEPAYLTGYFQSEKYFKDISGQVREAFRFSDQIWKNLDENVESKIKAYLDQIETSMAVSVHIRRGDYLENTKVYGGICTEDYYLKAIEVMETKFSEAVFFMFSNDPQWTEEWVRQTYGDKAGGGKFVIVSGTTEDTGYLDMFLMSKCKAHIIANSSFSWWGAWLDPAPEKIVIAPSKWFNDQDCRDVYTEEMIRISPEGKIEQG